MNFYKGSLVGASFYSGYAPFAPPPINYDTITFDANNDGMTIDKVYGLNIDMTKEYIDSISNTSFSPAWDINTYILAEFNDTLSAGNIDLEKPIDSWKIYRNDNTDNTLKYLDTIDGDVGNYTDFTALKNNTYKYFLFAQNDFEVASPVVSNEVECYYHGWYLIDIENQISYMFDLDLSGGEITQVEDISEYDTNLPYKVYSRGGMNYVEGNITALVVDECETMYQSVDLLETIKEFIFSDREKYLKDNKGRIFKVFTSGYSDSFITSGIINEPRYISFNFKEIGEV